MEAVFVFVDVGSLCFGGWVWWVLVAVFAVGEVDVVDLDLQVRLALRVE